MIEQMVIEKVPQAHALSLAEKIRQFHDRGLTRSQIAKICDTSYAYVYQVTKAHDKDKFTKLQEELGHPPRRKTDPHI